MAEINPVSLEEYLQMHPADLADRLQRLPLSDAQALLTLLRGLEGVRLRNLLQIKAGI